MGWRVFRPSLAKPTAPTNTGETATIRVSPTQSTSTPNQHHKTMSNQDTPPKESSGQTTNVEGLDDAACSPSVSGTPETDAMASTMFPDGSRWVQVEDCRKMERERNESRLMARDMRNQLEKESKARLFFPWENSRITQSHEIPKEND